MADIDALAIGLASASRLERQKAAAQLALYAKEDSSSVMPARDALMDALGRPEAQTRWESLEALSWLVSQDAAFCAAALPAAEEALFDEDNGMLRLAAVRFLCKLGAVSPDYSDAVWSLLYEGIRCYHGDPEFVDMMIAVIEFSTGDLSDQVKKSLAECMSFDAANNKGPLGRRAQQVLENLK